MLPLREGVGGEKGRTETNLWAVASCVTETAVFNANSGTGANRWFVAARLLV